MKIFRGLSAIHYETFHDFSSLCQILKKRNVIFGGKLDLIHWMSRLDWTSISSPAKISLIVKGGLSSTGHSKGCYRHYLEMTSGKRMIEVVRIVKISQTRFSTRNDLQNYQPVAKINFAQS